MSSQGVTRPSPLGYRLYDPLPTIQRGPFKIKASQDGSRPVCNALQVITATKQPSSAQCFTTAYANQPFVFDIGGLPIHSLQSLQLKFQITNNEALGVTHSPAQFYWQRIELHINDQPIHGATLDPLGNFYGLTLPTDNESTLGYAHLTKFNSDTYASTNVFAANGTTNKFILPLLIPGLDRSSLGLAFRSEKIQIKLFPQVVEKFTEVGTFVNSPTISSVYLYVDGVNSTDASDVDALRRKWKTGMLVLDNQIISDVVDYGACTQGVTRNDIQVRQTGRLSMAIAIVRPSGTYKDSDVYQSLALQDLHITDSAGNLLSYNVAPDADWIRYFTLNKQLKSTMSVTASYPVYAIVPCVDPQANLDSGTDTGNYILTGREKWYWTPDQTANREVLFLQYFNGGLNWKADGLGAEWVSL